MTTTGWRRLIFGFTIVSALLCLAFGAFAYMFRGMAHSEANRFFSGAIAPLIFFYGILGFGLIAMLRREMSGGFATKALASWNVIFLIIVFGSFAGIIEI